MMIHMRLVLLCLLAVVGFAADPSTLGIAPTPATAGTLGGFGTAGHLLVDSGSAWVSQALSGAGTLTSGGVLSLAGGDTTRHQIGLGTADTPTWVAAIFSQTTGTAPFTVSSTTNIPNLNASSLNGNTFAAPGAIGSTTASTGAFTTLSATGTTGQTALTVTGGTQTGASSPAISVTQTFNNAGTTYTAAVINVTDTASGISSLLQSWQKNSSQQAYIDKNGNAGFNFMTAAGGLVSNGTTESITINTGSGVIKGGCGITKNVLCGEGMHGGVAITATAAGTTTLATGSAGVQIFTGSTTQTVQLPAANLFGAGIAVHYTLINRSTGSVSWARAGSDLINGASSNVAVTTLTAGDIYSDGATNWYTR